MQNTRAAMWNSFFGNVGSVIARGLPAAKKFQLLNRCTTPILSYRCSRWPFNELLASELKSVHFKMCSALVRSERLEGDTPASFKIRRNRLVSQQALASESWVVKWCHSVLRWNAHLRRGVATSWIGGLPLAWDSEHFRHLRLEQGSASIFGGKTGTRSTQGCTFTRWQQGIEAAKQFNSTLPADIKMIH